VLSKEAFSKPKASRKAYDRLSRRESPHSPRRRGAVAGLDHRAARGGWAGPFGNRPRDPSRVTPVIGTKGRVGLRSAGCGCAADGGIGKLEKLVLTGKQARSQGHGGATLRADWVARGAAIWIPSAATSKRCWPSSQVRVTGEVKVLFQARASAFIEGVTSPYSLMGRI